MLTVDAEGKEEGEVQTAAVLTLKIAAAEGRRERATGRGRAAPIYARQKTNSRSTFVRRRVLIVR